MSPNAGVGGLRCGVSAKEYCCTHGVQINFGDLTLYLTYAFNPLDEVDKQTGGEPKSQKPETGERILKQKSGAIKIQNKHGQAVKSFSKSYSGSVLYIK
jgi:hypothetical protein